MPQFAILKMHIWKSMERENGKKITGIAKK